MSDSGVVTLGVVALIAGIVFAFAYSGHAERELQRDCMNAGGNWETRDGGGYTLGCRFPGPVKK